MRLAAVGLDRREGGAGGGARTGGWRGRAALACSPVSEALPSASSSRSGASVERIAPSAAASVASIAASVSAAPVFSAASKRSPPAVPSCGAASPSHSVDSRLSLVCGRLRRRSRSVASRSIRRASSASRSRLHRSSSSASSRACSSALALSWALTSSLARSFSARLSTSSRARASFSAFFFSGSPPQPEKRPFFFFPSRSPTGLSLAPVPFLERPTSGGAPTSAATPRVGAVSARSRADIRG